MGVEASISLSVVSAEEDEAGVTICSAVIPISSLFFACPLLTDLLVFIVAADGAKAGLVVGSKRVLVDGASIVGNFTLAPRFVGVVFMTVLGDLPFIDWDFFRDRVKDPLLSDFNFELSFSSFDRFSFDEDATFFFKSFDDFLREICPPSLPCDEDGVEWKSVAEVVSLDTDRCDFELPPPLPTLVLFDSTFEFFFHFLMVFVGSFPYSPPLFDDIPASPFVEIDALPPLSLDSVDIRALSFDDLLFLLLFSILLL